jgi:hypothetical protein
MKVKRLSSLLFGTVPAKIRTALDIVYSVYESRANKWGRDVVEKVEVVRRGGHEIYDINALPFEGGRKEMSFPARFAFVVKDAVVSVQRGRVRAGERWLGESFGNPFGASCEVFCYKFFWWLSKLFCRTLRLPPNGEDGYVLCRFDGYFHFVAESLVTLLYSLKMKPNACVVVCRNDYERVRYFREYIDTLKEQGKIRNLQLVDADFVSVERLVFTAFEPDAGMLCKESVDLLKETFGDMLTKQGGKRVFLTRKGRRRFDNQDAIENTLQTLGLDVVDTDGMSVREQMELFGASDLIVSNHGAGLTNLVWGRPGTAVVELFSEKWPNDCYFRLATLKGMRYRSMMANPSDGWGVVDCGRLRTIIEELMER